MSHKLLFKYYDLLVLVTFYLMLLLHEEKHFEPVWRIFLLRITRLNRVQAEM